MPVAKKPNTGQVEKVLEQARKAAVRYYKLTGKPLGITGEIGEYLAAKKLRFTLADARQAGYDATDKRRRKIQIKTRRVPKGKSLGGQRMGRIRLDHEWDVLMLVMLDEHFDVVSIHEGGRRAVARALRKTDSKARKRGALGVSEFMSLGKQVWPAGKSKSD